MKMKLGVLIAGFGLCMAAPLAAHHSWTADFDGGKPGTGKGTVSKVVWTNPHRDLFVDG
jgi:hypothetical protein